MKKLFIFMFVALAAFAISAFDDVETSSARTEVINVGDYDSQELQSSIAFSVSNPVNISESGAIIFDCVNTLDGYIAKVEAEERGSPELTIHFPSLRKSNAETRHLAIEQTWGHRLSKNKSLIGVNYELQNRS